MTTETQLEGAALNEALARALGWKWYHYHSPAGYWDVLLKPDITAESMVPGRHPRALNKREEEQALPDWQGDPAAAVELATELQMSGYLVEITMDHDMTVTCIITNGEALGKATRDTLPEAVAVAALHCLENSAGK